MEQGLKHKKYPHNALSAVSIRNTNTPGRYCDGNGLYLYVDPNGAKRWVCRLVVRGKRCDLGLGSLALVSLAEAREEAMRLRRIARIEKGDPLAERRQERRIVPTFEELAHQVHEEHSKGFRNPKHAAQWISTMEDYAFPVFGSKPVNQIESGDILAALSPIWLTKPETARRVRQRLRLVFDTAKAKGYRSGDNPVEGVGTVLPKHSKKSKEHHAALPYEEIPAFLAAMRESVAGIAVKIAFEFLILTATRTSECILAKWNEIDGNVWTVPAERMKAGVVHRVPLSPRCMELLAAAKEISNGGEYIFPGKSPIKPLSNMCFLMALRHMGREDITGHGFRSSFRDWAEEKTKTQRSVIEKALAHTVADKVEGAYLRSDLFDKRVPLMVQWAAFATSKPIVKVVNINREA